MRKSEMDYSKVKEVKEVWRPETVNKLLKQGWKLLGIFQETTDAGSGAIYVLGRTDERERVEETLQQA